MEYIINLTNFMYLFVSTCFNLNYNLVYDIREIPHDYMYATVINFEDNILTVEDELQEIYNFNLNEDNIQIGSKVYIKYKYNNIIDYQDRTGNIFPDEWNDKGIFSNYYNLAYEKLNDLTLNEKIGQLFLVRYNPINDIENLNMYNFGGYVFFKKDFKDKTVEEVQSMINNLQNNANIPLLTSVDEEGGSVIRISCNPNLSVSEFKSPSELFKLGSFELIKQDTIEKSRLLSSLGINLNLAPVVDVSTNPSDYMYERALGQDVNLTKEYAKTVIEASKNNDVSYTLKHFPGYGNNVDTHIGTAIDNRTYDSILINDIPPFEEGIKAGAEAVLVSHNVVTSIDSDNPASLSPEIHNILRDDLQFTGIIITDDLSMGATSSIEDVTVDAILAGNDLLIVTNYEEGIASIEEALNNGIINEELINKLAFRIIAWKYYKGLL